MSGSRKSLLVFVVVALLAPAGFIGCHGHDHDDDHLGPIGEACLHATDSPTHVSAAASSEAGEVPDVSAAHKLFHVMLVDDAENEGQKSGVVRYVSRKTSTYAVFLSADVPLSISDAQGNAVTISESYDVSACVELERQHNVDLGAGTYFFSFGPTSESDFSLIVESFADHDHAH
jgi:hypothetical protein